MSARVTIAALLAGGLAGACLRPGVFTCESADNCISGGIQGTCEPSGFCSYPSADCDSGQRYDEFAGAGLAGTCTEPGAGTGEESTGPGSTGEGSGSGDETGACPPACEDHDGDGYGEGDDCLGPDCDDDNPAHHDQCVYVSPEGDDDAAGTRDEPWLTFERALPELGPGQSLVLRAGTYALDTTGLPAIECGDGGNAQSGTAQAPISIRAEQEREPLLQGDGSSPAFSLQGCQHWRIFGLRGRNDDRSGTDGGQQTYTFVVRDSEDVVARRLLFSRSNRYFNAHLYGVVNSDRVRLEESEAYEFHREGFFLVDSDEVTLRRCYAYGSDYPDLPGCVAATDPELPYCSGTEDSGDTGFGAYRNVTRARLENCIAEGPLGAGFGINADCHDNLVVGSVVIGAHNGILVSTTDDLPSERNAVVDSAVVATTANGIYLRSTTQTDIRGVTVVDANGNGLVADQLQDCGALPGGCGFEARHALVLGSGNMGVRSLDQDDWLVEWSNAFGSTTNFPEGEDIADQAGNLRACTTIDAGPVGVGQGQCVVYIPEASPMKGAGEGGADIGATILYRIEGEPTDQPLWDPQTGAFPCGATDPETNDDPATACRGVHQRLGVASNGCALPDGYGEAVDPCG